MAVAHTALYKTQEKCVVIFMLPTTINSTTQRHDTEAQKNTIQTPEINLRRGNISINIMMKKNDNSSHRELFVKLLKEAEIAQGDNASMLSKEDHSKINTTVNLERC